MRTAAWIPLAMLLAGCAAALNEPPLRTNTARGLSLAELQRITTEARDLYETRELENVREAARLWETAATSGDAGAG